ncbi:hypothetical protein GGI17_000936 [Coemansia sp. S146]|nr:hypothetical protein GGI17_000936 [Coemansia sp. S146]
MVIEIDVTPVGDADKLLERRNILVIDLSLQLFEIVEKHTMITRGSDSLAKYMDLEPIRDLVHIEYFMDEFFMDVMPLITRNARTLQFLDINVSGADVNAFVRDPDGGGYLEYPHMHTLKIRSICDRVPSQEAIFKDVVPFPRLLRLSVRPSPHADDVLFRGNAGTLEYLEVRLIPETVSMLRKYKVFTPTSHPKLQCVEIHQTPARLRNTFATVAEYMQFVLSIAPEASVQVTHGLDKHPKDRSLALSMLKDHDCIQALSLPGTTLTLWEAISLVKSLPLLSDLHVPSLTVGELPQGVSMATFPGYVRATFAPMGKRFRCWHTHTYRSRKVDYIEIATCMLLLALICPNFDYAAIDKRHREPFMKAMQEKINEPEFSQNAPRLERLLLDGWKHR